jgi:hypothetical protein
LLHSQQNQRNGDGGDSQQAPSDLTQQVGGRLRTGEDVLLHCPPQRLKPPDVGVVEHVGGPGQENEASHDEARERQEL